MGTPNGFDDLTPVLIALAVSAAGVCGGLFLVILVLSLFKLTVQRTLRQVRPENRSVAPGLIWLDFVPIRNLSWGFISVFQIGSSPDGEFRSLGEHQPSDR